MLQSFLGSKYEDAFNKFIDDFNSVAAYDWWEMQPDPIIPITEVSANEIATILIAVYISKILSCIHIC